MKFSREDLKSYVYSDEGCITLQPFDYIKWTLYCIVLLYYICLYFMLYRASLTYKGIHHQIVTFHIISQYADRLQTVDCMKTI